MTSAIALERDRRLVEWHQAGDGTDAFVQLYALHYPRLVRLCRRSLGSDAHLAEDIAQDAFVRALMGLNSLGGERLFYPWLAVIARRLIAMHFRRARRRAAAYERAGAAASFVVAGPEDAAVDRLADADVHARAVEALGRVPERYREVIRLRVWEELSYAEIAARMGITSTAVAPLLHRARVTLRREFDALAPGDPATALVGFTSASWAALRRVRDRAAQWAATLPELGAMGVPIAIGLVGLGAFLGVGLLPTETHPLSQSGLGLAAPVHHTASAVTDADPTTTTPREVGAADQSWSLHPMTPSTDTNVTPGLVDNRLGNGVAEITTGEEAQRDRERARDMPYGQEIGPIWWNMDPNQIGETLQQVTS